MREENYRLIGEFLKNSSEILRVNLRRWGKGEYCDIREWVTLGAGGLFGLYPTKKGITLAVELLPELIRTLEKAQRTIEKNEDPAENRRN